MAGETVRSTRKAYLDVAKFLAVMSVIYVHSSITYNPVRRTIGAFFMPVFFVIYGMASSRRPLRSVAELRDFFLKKVRSLLVPYVLWSMIYAPAIDLSFCKGVVYGTNYSLGDAKTNMVLWFLPCMFVAVCLFQIYCNILSGINNRAYRAGYSLLVMGLCVVVSLWFRPHSPCFFGSDIAFMGCLFMIFGAGLSGFEEYWMKRHILIKLICGVLLFVVTCMFVTRNLPYLEKEGYYGVVIARGVYGRYDLFLCGAVTGSLALLIFAGLLQKVRLFAYMGKSSLVIMAVHHILFHFVQPVCKPIQEIRYGGYLFPAAVTLCCFLICIPGCFLVDWAVPELNGKRGGIKRQEPAAVQDVNHNLGVNSLE